MQNKHEGRWIEALGQAHDSREPAWAGVSGGIQLNIQSHKGRPEAGGKPGASHFYLLSSRIS